MPKPLRVFCTLDEVSIFSQQNLIALLLKLVIFPIFMSKLSTLEANISKPGPFSEKRSC